MAFLWVFWQEGNNCFCGGKREENIGIQLLSGLWFQRCSRIVLFPLYMLIGNGYWVNLYRFLVSGSMDLLGVVG